MNLAAIYEALGLINIVPLSGILSGSGASGANVVPADAATSVNVSIRADGKSTDLEAVVSVTRADGLNTVSAAAVAAEGEKTTTMLNLDVEASREEILSATIVESEISGPGNADVSAATTATAGDKLLISSEASAAATGEGPSASVAVVNDTELQDFIASVVGEVEAAAVIRDLEGAVVTTDASNTAGAGFEIEFAFDEDVTEPVWDGSLLATSVSALEAAATVEVLDFGVLESPSYQA